MKKQMYFHSIVTKGILLSIVSSLCVFTTYGAYELLYFIPRTHGTDWHDPNTQFHTRYGWAPIPHRSIVDFDNAPISSNSLGYRSAELAPNTSQIIVCGDSIAWGYGVGDTDTVTYYSEEKIQGKMPNTQVLNLAVSGYGIDQTYLWVKDNITKQYLTPEKVIYISFPANDFDETGRSVSYARSKPMLSLVNGQVMNQKKPVRKYSRVNVFETSRLFQNIHFFRKWKPYAYAHEIVLSTNQRNDLVYAILKEFKAFLNSRDIPLEVVIVPYIPDRSAFSTEYILMKDFLEDLDIPYIDYDNELETRYGEEKSNLYLSDQYHYNAQGNHALASTITDLLF